MFLTPINSFCPLATGTSPIGVPRDMLSLDHEKLDQEELLTYPVQIPRINLLSVPYAGLVDLHITYKKMVLASSSDSLSDNVYDKMSLRLAKTRMFLIYWRAVKWIGITNMSDPLRGERNYTTLYLTDNKSARHDVSLFTYQCI